MYVHLDFISDLILYLDSAQCYYSFTWGKYDPFQFNDIFSNITLVDSASDKFFSTLDALNKNGQYIENFHSIDPYIILDIVKEYNLIKPEIEFTVNKVDIVFNILHEKVLVVNLRYKDSDTIFTTDFYEVTQPTQIIEHFENLVNIWKTYKGNIYKTLELTKTLFDDIEILACDQWWPGTSEADAKKYQELSQVEIYAHCEEAMHNARLIGEETETLIESWTSEYKVIINTLNYEGVFRDNNDYDPYKSFFGSLKKFEIE